MATDPEPDDKFDCNDDPKLTDEEWEYVLALEEDTA